MRNFEWSRDTSWILVETAAFPGKWIAVDLQEITQEWAPISCIHALAFSSLLSCSSSTFFASVSFISWESYRSNYRFLEWKSLIAFNASYTLWRICPTTVSLLLKYEPIEMNQKFKFLVEDTDVWKFLKTSRASTSTSFRFCIEMKIFGV